MDLYKSNGYVKIGSYHKTRYMVRVSNHIPLCYVEIPEKLRTLLGNRPDVLAVHGGITFAGSLNNISGYWIGWDYGHFGDYIPDVQSGVQWTEEDLVVHCESAIIQLESL